MMVRMNWTKLSLMAVAAVMSLPAQDRNVPIENDKVKVLKVTQAPHIKTRLHKHDMNRVMIYLQPGKQTIDYQGGKTTVLNWKAGEPLWSPKSGMHIAEITSDNPVTIVEIELKNVGRKVTPPALDPVKIDRKHYKVEFENDQVRVIRSTIGAKESVALHEHALDRVVVYLTDQNFKITTDDGKATMAQHKAGDVSWAGPVKHKEENLADKTFEILAVEIK